ncbi:MAG: OmpH family outer membrane protein [Bacteroidia bacterium]|nr:OmpH family outer membrane protein [Bacteroidia bacterium]
MKNISLILNAILLAAVGILFYLHFSGGVASSTSPNQIAPGDLKMAFINSDSVLKYYDYFKENRTKLEAKGKKLDQELRGRAQGLQNDYEAYQRNVGNLTIGQAKAIEEDLTKKQQNLRLYQESLSQELSTEEGKMNVDLYSKITTFLKKYSEEKGIQLVLKFDPTSDVLYGESNLDITQDVIAGLNEAYKVDKAIPSTKNDSTAAKKN